MMSIKFAVVREDPIIEQNIIEKILPNKVLMIASGGCTALSLKSNFSQTDFTLFDINPAQIKLVKNKIEFLKDYNFDLFNNKFNINTNAKEGLNNCGEFESLFRCLRQFIEEFIAPKEFILNIFIGNEDPNKLFTNKYWPVAFDLFFSNSLLLTMFGPNALQHAEPHSYPKYFQKVFEDGFHRTDYKRNYFLHHIFLGYYLNDLNAQPYYLQQKKQDLEFEYINDNLLNIKNINQFQLISLSNIFDWMSDKEVIEHLNYLSINLNPGSFIIFRQLNNNKNYLDKTFSFRSHEKLENSLIAKDQSLFYNKINILEKL